MEKNVIYSINGPVITVADSDDFLMLEMVYVGHKRLLGEVIGIRGNITTIQVYESTTGLKINEPVYTTGSLLSAQLGPGILANIFDGIERPLKTIYEKTGAFIQMGSDVASLDNEKLWDVDIKVSLNDEVRSGIIFATTQETSLIEHRCMIPNGIKGKVTEVRESGKYTIDDVLITVVDEKGNTHELTLVQKWPIRKPRPVKKREEISRPLITGQRIFDTMFPLAKGGAAAIPGGFGAGKTMSQHQIAKWCDADIIVYVGCGERGNEMTQVLEEFSELVDPKSNQPLLDRTVLIANTSNMPVAAREASIYTGITLAEYYRDMGYHVALIADSTSRWAEALREISGRLEEMPAEEGFPAYLPSRISQFYERASYVETLNGQEGSVTIVGAVSPQGGDFSEPVTQNTKRFIRTFWALDKSLAYARHYPAVNWNQSYSNYVDSLSRWYTRNIGKDFLSLRDEFVKILHDESESMEIVKLIGADVLPDDKKLTLEIARVVRVGFLQQNAYHKQDTYVPFDKQYKTMKIISYLYAEAKKLIAEKKTIRAISETGIFDRIIKIKYEVSNDNIEELDNYYGYIDRALESVE